MVFAVHRIGPKKIIYIVRNTVAAFIQKWIGIKMPVNMGKILLVTGIVLAITGVAIMFISKFSAIDALKGTGKLPGDMYIQKKNFTFYFPIATSILISIILSIVFYSLGYFKK